MSEDAGYDDGDYADDYADDDGDEAPAQGHDDNADDDGDNAVPKYTKAQVESMIRSRFPEYSELREKADQFDSLFEASQGAQAAEADWRTKAEQYEADLAYRDVLLLRQEVAASKGLDTRLWSRVQGDTREEIEADIGELQGFAVNSRRPASLRSGASTDSPTDRKERAAQAFRQARDAR